MLSRITPTEEHRLQINRNPHVLAKHDYLNETFNDRWIIEYVFPGKEDGYFVEAGAANGKDASSCYLLETQLNWRGICIEPHPQFAPLVQKNRPNSIHEQVCLSDQVEFVAFIIAGGDPDVSPYISGVKGSLEDYKWQGREVVHGGESQTMQAVPLVDLLRRHHAPKVIDYAAFDIEGSEFKVIDTFPFDEYRFLALSVESDEWVWEKMLPRLQRFGYRQVANPFCDKVWEKYCVHESIWDESFVGL
ncbi:MAG: FkbM family methyltransferase [Synechococcales cyanobacterium RM1_1_8]|nr:FkbM family methyltransferase [Synechococcales cyanobacterium RM1_1_8]